MNKFSVKYLQFKLPFLYGINKEVFQPSNKKYKLLILN